MMNQTNSIVYSILKAVGILAALVLLLYFFYEIRTIFAYILVAFVVALVGRPMVNLLNRRLKIPNSIGAGITLFLLLTLFFGFFYFFFSILLEEPLDFLQSYQSFEQLEEDVSRRISSFRKVLADYHLGFLNDQINVLRTNMDVQRISDLFGNSLSLLGGLVMDVFSITFISYFFLKDKDTFQNMVVAVMPDKHETRILRTLEKIKNLLSRYFIGLIIQVMIMFSLYLIILLVFGVEYAALIALLCGIMNLIPYVGPLIGGVIMLLFSTSYFLSLGLDFQSQILPKLLWILGLYILAQLEDNFINQPKIYSSSVRSTPLEIFLVILAGGLIFGIVGVIIAVPGYTVLRVILKEFFSEYKLVQNLTKGI